MHRHFPQYTTSPKYRLILGLWLLVSLCFSEHFRVSAQIPSRVSDPFRTTTGFVYSSFLGGSGIEVSQTSLIDSQGNVILIGNTTSQDYFITNAFQSSSKDKSGTSDLVLTKLTPTGEVVFSTYLSGKRNDAILRCMLDTNDNIYALIDSNSLNLPLKNEFSRRGTLCLAKFDPTGQPVFITKLPGEADYSTQLLLDQQNNAILVGRTYDRNFPLVKPLQTNFNNSVNEQVRGFDTFITKLGPTGRPIYSTFLGGFGDDPPEYACVHYNGDVTVVGSTGAQNFPLKQAFQKQNMGNSDLFIARISSGGQLIYSTLFGTPSQDDDGGQLLVDSEDNVILYGRTTSSRFPLYNQGNTPIPSDEYNLFFLKVNPAGQRVFAKLLGGSREEDFKSYLRADHIPEVFLDAENSIYFFGTSSSADLPVTNATQATFGGARDWMFGKMSPDGELQHLSYWGGKDFDQMGSVLQDANGDFIITQHSSETSTDMPEVHPFWSGDDRIYTYLAKIDRQGQVVYASRFPSTTPLSIKLDASSNVILSGLTVAENFPLMNAAFPAINQGKPDIFATADLFVTKIRPDGSLSFSTYLGGSKQEKMKEDAFDSSLYVDAQGNIFVIGQSDSDDFPQMSPLQTRPSKVAPGELTLSVTGFGPTGEVLFSTFFGGQRADYIHSIYSPQPKKLFLGGTTSSHDFPTANALHSFQGNTDAFVSLIQFETPGQ